MAQRKIVGKWYVDITHHGKRYRRKSPSNTRTGAREFEATIRRDLANGSSFLEEPKQEKPPQGFEEFVQFWFQTHVLVHNKPSMIAKTRGILDRKLIPFFGKTRLDRITTLQVERFKAMRAGEGVANKTINSELGVLGKCLRDAKRWVGVVRIPDIVMLKLAPTHFDFFSEKECDKLLGELSGVWYDLTYVALKTGLRRGELQALRWKDVQFGNKTLTVSHSRCAITGELLSPKGNKIRSVPLPDDVVRILQARRNKSEYVFSVNGDMFDGQMINRKLVEACKRSGLRKITCHVLRHSYASHLALKGVPIVIIQKLLGHTDIKVTMRYAHLSQESINEVVQRLQRPFAGPIAGKA